MEMKEVVEDLEKSKNNENSEHTVDVTKISNDSMADDYRVFNSMVNLLDAKGGLQLEQDQVALSVYFKKEINPKYKRFDTLQDKLNFLFDNEYYERKHFDKYDFEFIKGLYKKAYAYNFRFGTFMAALKFYSMYAMKTFDGNEYLESFEDRVVANAIFLGSGNTELASQIVEEMITRRYQPATPTFSNAVKAQRGSYTSCYLLNVDDNLESITRSITDAQQLSKRGGGVALNLTNLRESGAPIKNFAGQGSGVVPVMKLYEDSFKYANQLGQRQGAGAVYLSAHHPDILEFLDTKKENADEAIRIKTLSIGVIIPDVTYHLSKNNQSDTTSENRGNTMALFSPYDVKKVYGLDFNQVDITAMYDELVANDKITKKWINPRSLFSQIAKMQFESGYPYIMNIDNANKVHNNSERITMSNLCSEILQGSSPSTFNVDGSFDNVGRDISCNLGSLNVDNTFNSENFALTVETAMRALTTVTNELDEDIECSPSVQRGNQDNHAVGLGQMNLHGFFARNFIHYDSEEAVDFTRMYFYSTLYHVLRASNKIAQETGSTYWDFAQSKYASGEFFDKYTDNELPSFATDKVKNLFANSTVYVPTREDWVNLKEDVMEHGLYHAYTQAVAPTGSISYVNESTSSIHPIVAPIEARKDGMNGRVFVPMPHLNDATMPYYRTAYMIDNKAIIDVYAAAQEFVDQGMSLTLFYSNENSTRDLVRTYIYAWTKGIKTLYYARIQTKNMDGTDVENANSFCESCML